VRARFVFLGEEEAKGELSAILPFLWHFRTWFRRHVSDGLMVGLGDLRSLFQP